MNTLKRVSTAGALIATVFVVPAYAAPFFFSTGNVDGRMAAASRPAAGGKIEIEAADDFVITGQTQITSATFIGVITGAIPTVGEVAVEIYRVFPFDSVIPPSGNVPTRANSPSDVAYDTRDSGLATLSFLTSTLSPNFTAQNSVLNGINKSPNQTTGGEGPVSGMEVQFTVNFVTPFDLATNHYFFIPQVQITGGEFYWLSSVRPIVAPGTPFAPDLQAWTRNANLDPDWLRIGTDIVGGDPPPTFDEAFTLTGQTVAVPEPASLPLLAAGLSALVFARRRKKTA